MNKQLLKVIVYPQICISMAEKADLLLQFTHQVGLYNPMLYNYHCRVKGCTAIDFFPVGRGAIMRRCRHKNSQLNRWNQNCGEENIMTAQVGGRKQNAVEYLEVS